MATLACPQCGEPLLEIVSNGRRCPSCGSPLPDEAADHAVETPRPSDHITGPELVPKLPGVPSLPEADFPEPDVPTFRRSRHGETMAILALLLPLVAQTVTVGLQMDTLELALSWGTVIITALVLAVDAGMLGTTDLEGNQRCSPQALFFGVLLLWIIFYPAAFFRRRHFGRPNLGPFALLVACFFVAAPFLHNFTRFGTIAGGLPTCDSREIVAMVDDMIRKNSNGLVVQSITGHHEISFDAANQIRKGQCQATTRNETITVTFTVRMLNAKTGTYWVELEPIISGEPPSCTDAEVIKLVERLIRDQPKGPLLKSVADHKEVRYDHENKTRHGRCRATFEGEEANIAYKVYWLDRNKGTYQVEIEP